MVTASRDQCRSVTRAPRTGRTTSWISSVALLLDLGRLPDPIAEVVELGATHVAARDPLDLGDDGRVHGERALHTDAEAHLADGEGLPGTLALATDHHALEHLH